MRAGFHLGAVLAAVVAACGGTTGLEGDADVSVETPTEPALDPPSDPPTDPVGPGITFRISFVTDIPDDEHLFVQVSDEMGHQTWASVEDGGTMQPLQWRCDLCMCDECSECAVCGPALTMVERVSAGDSTTWTWDGTLYPLTTCTPGPGAPEEQCQEIGWLHPGTYAARFCWGTGPVDAFPDGWIPDPVCDTVEFDYPVEGDGVVEYLVNNGG